MKLIPVTETPTLEKFTNSEVYIVSSATGGLFSGIELVSSL